VRLAYGQEKINNPDYICNHLYPEREDRFRRLDGKVCGRPESALGRRSWIRWQGRLVPGKAVAQRRKRGRRKLPQSRRTSVYDGWMARFGATAWPLPP
jgi:hypothetical protein